MRALHVVLVSGALASCGFPEPALLGGDAQNPGHDGSPAGDAAHGDAGSGSGAHDGSVQPLDGPASQVCYGNQASAYFVCLSAAPTTPLTGSLQVLTGDAGTGAGESGCAMNVTEPNNNSVCVAAFSSITLGDGNTVTATGGRPFVLVADTDMLIGEGATIDVGSHRSGSASILGAGAMLGPCGTGTESTLVGTGGAGGSFGGIGGPGNAGGINNGAVSEPGATVARTSLGSLRGGCAGQPGTGNAATAAGMGGGTIALIANGQISVNGVVAAGGEGGTGGGFAGTNYYGGAGAGAGGMIQIDAQTLTGTSTNGILAAPGGGGGQGAGMIPGAFAGSGAAGADPAVQPGTETFSTGAPGGTSTITGAAGGNGSTTGSIAGAGGGKSTAGSSTGGGGGGGGGGWILIHVSTNDFPGIVVPASASD